MTKSKTRNLLYPVMIFALMCGLIFTPQAVYATESTPEGEQPKKIEPISLNNNVLEESVEATEGWTAGQAELVGTTIEQDDIDEEDPDKATWTLKTKITGIPTIATYVSLLIGEEEPDGNVYLRTEIYLNASEIRDAVNGTLKVAKKVQSSDGWKPAVGQDYHVAVIVEGKSYPEGEYKYSQSGYKKRYKVRAGEKTWSKRRKANKRRLTVRFKNHNKRLIGVTKSFFYAEGESYTIAAPDFDGYTLSADSQKSLTGKMGAEDNTVDIAYEGDTVPVKVSFVCGSDEIAETYNENKKVGDFYSVDAPEVSGYKISNEYNKTVKGVVTAGGVDRIVDYIEEKYALIINHLDENGKELYPQADSYLLKPGEAYYYDDTTSKPIREFEGYTLSSGDYAEKDVDNGDGTTSKVKYIQGTMPREKRELTLNYIHNREAVKINFEYEGITEETARPTGMPTEPKVLVAASEDDITYVPPVVEGWTLVGAAGYASSWYDSRKNLVTIPANNYLMRASTEDKPYEITYTYKQQVERTVSFRYDDPGNTKEIAPSKTYTLLAGTNMDVPNPVIDGYINSKGNTTRLVANGGSDVTVYYTPYTEENGWRIVEGIPGDVTFDTSCWNPERPDDPYKATFTFSWTANLDTDSSSVWNQGGVTKVYFGDEYVGDLDQYNRFVIYTDDAYFKDNHDKFEVTLYQQRSKSAYYGYDNGVYVKTEWTLKLPENPIKAENDKDSLYKVVPVMATVSPADMDAYSNVEKTFKLTFDPGSRFSSVNVGWTITADDVKALGTTEINKNHHVLVGKSDSDEFVLERNGLLGVYGYSIQATGLSSEVTENDNGSATYTLSEVPLGTLIGEVDLDGWYFVGMGWIHLRGSIARPDGEIVTATNLDGETEETTNTDIEASSCEYGGYGRRYNWSDGAFMWNIEWSDKSNNYKRRHRLTEGTFTNGQKESTSWYSFGYSDFGSRIIDKTFAFNNYKYNATVPVYAEDDTVVGYLSPEKVGKNEQTGFEWDYPHINSETGECIYKGTVYISRENYLKYKDSKLHFTRRNTGIGTKSDRKDTAGNDLYAFTYHNGDITRYVKDADEDEYEYAEVLKNSTSTISFTLSETGSETINDVEEYDATVNASDSTLTKDGEFTVVMTVDQRIADAWDDNVQVQNIQMFMCPCDDNADAVPIYSTDVFGQGWETSPSCKFDGTKLTLSGTFDRGYELSSLISGGKYKVAVLFDGYLWIGGTEENGYLNNAQYYTAEAMATLTVPASDSTTIKRSLKSLEITSAQVERTYVDPKTGEKYPQLKLAWATTFDGDALDENDMKVYSRQRYDYYGGTEDVQVVVSIYDKETGEDVDYYTSSDDQRVTTISADGGTYECYFTGTGTSLYREKLSGAYVISVVYKYKTSDKYGNTVWKTESYGKDIKRETGTISDENVLFQVDDAGNGLVRVTGDRKLVKNDFDSENNPTATIWYDGEKYDESQLAKETSNGEESEKNWSIWFDLSDATGKALDTSKLQVSLSGRDYDANTFDVNEKYDAVSNDFVTITKAKEKKDSFEVAFKSAVPEPSFRPVYAYWSISGASDVEADNGAIVESEDQKISIYSGDVIYSDTEKKDSTTGLYFGKFKSLAGKTLKVKLMDHNKMVTYASKTVIGESEEVATNDVVITKAEYDINGNLTLAGTFDNEVVNISSWNYYNMYVEGADGETYSTNLYEDNGFTIDPEAGTFSYSGKTFSPSGNSIFGYTLREFAGLSDDEKKFNVTVSLNGTESGEFAFTYLGGELKVEDSMIKEGKGDDEGYLVVALPRGYFTNAVNIDGVIVTAIEDGKGVKFTSAEDDIEFAFDATTIATMTGEEDALLAVSKYTAEMPENVKKSGLSAVASYEIQLSRKYTGKAKVRFIAEAKLAEGSTPEVYYVDSEGKTEKMSTTYSINQYEEIEAYSELPHCSTFAVVYDSQAEAKTNVTVTFDANGGTGTMDPQVVKKGVATELKANTFARSGYTFEGWAESKTATSVKYVDKAKATFDADITLYAVWKESGSGNNEQGGGSGQNEQGGGSGQSGQSGDAGQTTTPITETPAAPAVTGSTVSDATSGAEYVVTTEAGSKQTVEYKVPTVAMTQTIIVIPATVVVNGTQYEVTSIADKAFKDNTTVTSITIGENVETIGDSAFEGCTSLNSITIPASVSTIGDSAFKGCSKLKTATLSKGVTEIGDKAFANCTSLTKVSIPSTVTKIGDQAFSGDKKLKSATIGNNVTEIGDKAFANCSSLTSITIPKKVNKLGANVFKGAKKLKTITVKNTKLNSKNVSKNAFKGISNKTVIKVPKSKKKAYTTLFRKKGLSKKVKIK